MTTASTAPPRPGVRCDRTAAWAALAGHFEAHGRDFDLREAFARDPRRFESMSFDAPEVFADLSKNLVDAATLRFLADLARECGVEAQRDAMLAGAPVNNTERRAVLHVALRAPRVLPHSPTLNKRSRSQENHGAASILDRHCQKKQQSLRDTHGRSGKHRIASSRKMVAFV